MVASRNSTDESNHPYPYSEFLEDFLSLVGRAPEEKKDGEAVRRSLEHFSKRYFPDAKKMVWRMARCDAAAAYWLKHKYALSRGDISVAGDEGALVKGRLTMALWICWAREDCDPMNYDPPIEAFIQVCEDLGENTFK